MKLKRDLERLGELKKRYINLAKRAQCGLTVVRGSNEA